MAGIIDTHLAYHGLSYEYAAHETVNHSQQQYKNGIASTNGVEDFFSCLNVYIGYLS